MSVFDPLRTLASSGKPLQERRFIWSSKRSRRAVLVSLEVTEDGSIISLDDAVQTDHPEDWKKAEHYTQIHIAGDFLDLPNEEFSAFGYHILARLSAVKAGGEL